MMVPRTLRLGLAVLATARRCLRPTRDQPRRSRSCILRSLPCPPSARWSCGSPLLLMECRSHAVSSSMDGILPTILCRLRGHQIQPKMEEPSDVAVLCGKCARLVLGLHSSPFGSLPHSVGANGSLVVEHHRVQLPQRYPGWCALNRIAVALCTTARQAGIRIRHEGKRGARLTRLCVGQQQPRSHSPRRLAPRH